MKARAGKPTFIVPFFGDQPFWGAACEHAGVGPPPVPIDQLTTERVVDALKELILPTSVCGAGGGEGNCALMRVITVTITNAPTLRNCTLHACLQAVARGMLKLKRTCSRLVCLCLPSLWLFSRGPGGGGQPRSSHGSCPQRMASAAPLTTSTAHATGPWWVTAACRAG
jgi:hypothetical protein